MSSGTPSINSIAVETSGRIGSVAVACGTEIAAEASFSTKLQHGVELLPTADRLCRQAGLAAADLAHVYVSGGPGSFTGLRIGITFAKAMALAVGAKVVRVPTLEVIAQNALLIPHPPDRVVVVLDAKRRNIFCAAFARTDSGYAAIDQPAERDPLAYLPTLGPIAALGEGIAYHAEAVAAATDVNVLEEELNQARAAVVHGLGAGRAERGEFVPAAELIPIYIRRPEAEEKWEERHGGGATPVG